MSRNLSTAEQSARREKRRQNSILYRQRKREKGLCALCPSPVIAGMKCCVKCLEREQDRRNHLRFNKLCLACGKKVETEKKKCENCLQTQTEQIRQLKKRILDHYGHQCQCSCGCRVNRFNHLTMDHVNGDGKQHRQQGIFGRRLYSWIIKNNFPPSIQLLCWNCNCAKQMYGGCD